MQVVFMGHMAFNPAFDGHPVIEGRGAGTAGEVTTSEDGRIWLALPLPQTQWVSVGAIRKFNTDKMTQEQKSAFEALGIDVMSWNIPSNGEHFYAPVLVLLKQEDASIAQCRVLMYNRDWREWAPYDPANEQKFAVYDGMTASERTEEPPSRYLHEHVFDAVASLRTLQRSHAQLLREYELMKNALLRFCESALSPKDGDAVIALQNALAAMGSTQGPPPDANPQT